jgi:lysophospholipase L1-like esterase
MISALLLTSFFTISPSDPRIAYIGRFNFRNPAAIACQWPASEVRLQVKGQSLIVKISETGNDHWQVVVDGQPKQVFAPKGNTADYKIDLGTAGTHEVRLIKRTEAFVGTTWFEGFEIPGGQLLASKPKKRHLEFVGDSITCGYGNEGTSQNDRFKPETENAYLTYASIAARALSADVTILAWSGRKMWPDNSMPEIYDRVLPTEPQPVFDFKGPAPNAVIINLATNDFGKDNPDEAKWTNAYETFIKRVWGRYPKAHIYVAMGSMMSDNWPPEKKALSTLRGYLQRMIARIGKPHLHLIEFDVQRQEDGIGSDWHPNVATHKKMAAKLTEAIKRDLRW